MTRPAHRAGAARRLPILVAIAALIVAGAVVDRRARPAAEASAARQLDTLMPTAPAADALTSAWYCPGGSASPNGPADAFVTVANPTDRALDATVTVVPSSGEAKAAP